MATRSITHEELPELEASYDDVTNDENDAAQIEADIWAEMGASNSADYTIKLYRVPQAGGAMPWLFDVPGQSIAGLLLRLRDEYGDGNYEARVYKRTDGKSRLRKREVIAIERAKSAPVVSGPTAQDSALLEMVKKQGDLLNLLTERLANQSAPVAPTPPPQPSMLEMFTGMAMAMKAMRGAFDVPAAVVAPAADPFKMLASAMSLAKEMQNDGREKGMIDLVGDFLQSPLVGQLTAQMSGQPQPAPQQPQRGLPAPGPNGAPQNQPRPQQAQAAPVAPANSAPGMTSPEFGAVKSLSTDFPHVIADYARKAVAGKDPYLYADLLADEYPAVELQQLIQTPNLLDLLAGSYPEVAANKDWFGDVLNGLQDHFEADPGAIETMPLTSAQTGEQMPGAPNTDPAGPVVSGSASPPQS